MSRTFHIFSWIVMSAAFLLMLLASYWLFWPDTVITFKNPNQISVGQKIYHPGDRLSYNISYCKNRNLIGTVDRALVDGVRVVFNTISSNLPTGCHETEIKDVVIPEFVDEGTYHVDIQGTYHVNPLRDFVVYLHTEEFRIEK